MLCHIILRVSTHSLTQLAFSSHIHTEALTMSKNSLIGDIPTEFGKLTKMGK